LAKLKPAARLISPVIFTTGDGAAHWFSSDYRVANEAAIDLGPAIAQIPGIGL
jgi:hypothetical protein